MLERRAPPRAERALQPPCYVSEPSDDIDDVINELVGQNAVATIVVPERERVGRTPTPGELAHPEAGPSVMVDASLWVHGPVACRPQGTAIALGTIPPPLNDLAVYCVFDPTPITEKVEFVDDDLLGCDDLDGDPSSDDVIADDEADEVELDIEFELDLDDFDDA